MKALKQYAVDAFTDKVFAGNPAAVCVLDQWLSDELMQKIAIENNLSETAFVVKEGDLYQLSFAGMQLLQRLLSSCGLWNQPANKCNF